MNSQSLLASTILLLGSTILLLAPTVDSCVNFQAYYVGPGSGGHYPLSAQLYDGGSEEVCWLDSVFLGSDGLLHFTCNAGYAATMTPTLDPPSVVQYSTPNGNYQWSTPFDNQKQMWYACEYGCSGSECFVPVPGPGQPGGA